MQTLYKCLIRFQALILIFIISIGGTKAYDKPSMANFGATNYPCNTKMPWVDSSFTGLTASVIDPAAEFLLCTGSNTGLANLLDNNLSDFASINFTLGLGDCNSTLSVKDNDAADTYPAGTFAGYRIGTAGLLGVSIGSSITIETYNNGNPVESQVVVNTGLGLNSSLLNGDGTATVGFVTTAAFDEIRITYQALIAIAFTGTVYHAVVQRFCAGPSLACNVQTRMNNPIYPTLINGSNTGITGGVCVGCSVNDAESAVSSSTADFATIVLTAALGTTGSIAVKDQITDYPAGTFAGFDIENTALVDVTLLGGITISTYLNGNPVAVESKTGPAALLSVSTALLTNSGRRTVGFVTTAPFDEVKLSISNTVLVNVGITRVYNVFFEKFCPVVLECNTTNYLNGPDFPVIIDDALTGVDGVTCIACSVEDAPYVITDDNTDYTVITTVIGASSPASIAVKDVLTTFPAGSTAGFVIRDVNTILQVELFNSITITTYNDGIPQESRSGSGLLDLAVLSLLNVSLTGPGDFNIGFRTTLPYDEIQISVGSLVSVINIIRVYGAFVDTRGANDGNLNCCPTTAPSLSSTTPVNVCPAVTVNLSSLVIGMLPANTTVVWFTNNTATGTPYATPTAATANTYYAFFYDTIDNCYGPASSAVTVTINACPPTITSNGGGSTASISVPENTTAVTIVTATDPENGIVTYNITGGADAAKFTINLTTGELIFNTPPDFETPTDVGGNNVYNVQVTATDPSNATDVQDIAVTVTDVNEPPAITSDGGGATATIPVVENTTAVTTVTATDPENAFGVPKFTITGGADATLFTINAATGALSFNTARNFEVPTDADLNNMYEVQVTVTDAGGLIDVQAITVPVTDVNEPPTITSNGGGATATVATPENTTAVTTVTATDPENLYGTPKFSITGGADAALFTIDPNTGALTFNTVPNFETPTDVGANNVYDVQVTVTDAGNLTDVQDIAVTVTDVNENGQLSVKVLLQGALLGSPTPGIMRDDLRSGNHIPLKDPYTGSGNPRFAHAGAGAADSTTLAILAANAGTDHAIVDWVFVELRSALDSTVVVETRVALLQRDGDVVSPADGVSPLVIAGTAGNAYFVAVKHRSHLGVMTAAEVTITSVGTTVDFRTMSDADVYHTTTPFSYDGHEMVTVSGFKALWAGNANGDKKVKYQGPSNDNGIVLAQVLGFSGNTAGIFNYDLTLGYFSGDINMDGKVKYQGASNDPGFIFLNLITNFTLNSLDLYNYDLFSEQIP